MVANFWFLMLSERSELLELASSSLETWWLGFATIPYFFSSSGGCLAVANAF